MTDLTKTIIEHLEDRFQNNELSNKDLSDVIGYLGRLLNLRTISEYSKSTGISYNGVLSRVDSGKISMFELFNVKFVIDNL